MCLKVVFTRQAKKNVGGNVRGGVLFSVVFCKVTFDVFFLGNVPISVFVLRCGCCFGFWAIAGSGSATEIIGSDWFSFLSPIFVKMCHRLPCSAGSDDNVCRMFCVCFIICSGILSADAHVDPEPSKEIPNSTPMDPVRSILMLSWWKCDS